MEITFEKNFEHLGYDKEKHAELIEMLIEKFSNEENFTPTECSCEESEPFYGGYIITMTRNGRDFITEAPSLGFEYNEEDFVEFDYALEEILKLYLKIAEGKESVNDFDITVAGPFCPWCLASCN